MKKRIKLLFGWHSHTPLVFNLKKSTPYISGHLNEKPYNWFIESFNAFESFLELYWDNQKFKSFLDISGVVLKQFKLFINENKTLDSFLKSKGFSEDEIAHLRVRAKTIIKNLRYLVSENKLEMVGISAQHAIMPFLDEESFDEELIECKELYKELFNCENIQGVWPTEGCIYKRDVKLYHNNGFKFLITEDPNKMQINKRVDGNKPATITVDDENDMIVLGRDRILSLFSWKLRDCDYWSNKGHNYYDTVDESYGYNIDSQKDDAFFETQSEYLHYAGHHINRVSDSRFGLTVDEFVHSIVKKARDLENGDHILLFTDFEYYGGAKYIFPLISQAVSVLSDPDKLSRFTREIEFELVTPSAYIKNSTLLPRQNMILEKGSWITGFQHTEKFQVKHGKLYFDLVRKNRPAIFWEGYIPHYRLSRERFKSILNFKHLFKDKEDNSLFEKKIEIIRENEIFARSSCHYGWCPPIYRYLPIIKAFTNIHNELSFLEDLITETRNIYEFNYNPLSESEVNLMLSNVQYYINLLDISARNNHVVREYVELSESMLNGIKEQLLSSVRTDIYYSYMNLIKLLSLLDGAYIYLSRSNIKLKQPMDFWDLWRRQNLELFSFVA